MADINNVFERLDEWRHLPSYQLERRADIFFALYLREILNAHADDLGIAPVTEHVIPEFPVRVDQVGQGTSNQSVHVDYLVMTEEGQAVLVELKTDMESLRDRQFEYLDEARKLPLADLVDGILRIYPKTRQKGKYEHLFRLMKKAGMIDLDDPKRARVTATDGLSQVVVIQPLKTPDDPFPVLTFDQVAAVLSGIDDDLASRFARSVLEWRDPAGESKSR